MARVRKTTGSTENAPDTKTAKKRKSSGLFTFIRRALKPIQPFFSFLAKLLRRITPSYFVNSFREVRKVTWPNRGETWRLTLAVFVFAAIFGALVAVVDRGLDEIFKKVVLR